MFFFLGGGHGVCEKVLKQGALGIIREGCKFDHDCLL